ncbi:MAG: tetracycline resistance MFS efflux pump [Deltaproteobacteria bacterium]|nr:tetracycline resistance MFS efflux pump [Deltaproteobacteria bacterium]
MPSSSKSHLLVAFITIFLDLLGFGIIIPILPFFTKSLGASPTLITLLAASYSLMQFLFSPFWGYLSDKKGRRPIMLSSIFISGIGYLIFASATQIWVLFLARILSGFGNANLGTAQAIISDSTSGEERSKGMGLIGAAFGLGFIFGPAIGAFLSQYSPQTPIYAAGILSFGNLILTYFILPETKDPSIQPEGMDKVFNTQLLQQAKKYTNLIPIFFISFIGTVAFSQIEQIIALFIEAIWVPEELMEEEKIKTAARYTGYYLTIIGVVAAIIQGGLIGKLNKRFGEVTLIRAGLIIIMTAIIMIPFIGSTKSFLLLLISGPYLALGTSILNPSKSSLISRSIPSQLQGTMLGLNQSFSSLGRVIGPSVAGLLFEISINIPFYIGAGMMLPAIWWSLYLRAPHQSTEPKNTN